MVRKNIKYNPGEKSLKAPFAIYLEVECLLKKEQSSQNNPKKLYIDKKRGMSSQCLQDVYKMFI